MTRPLLWCPIHLRGRRACGSVPGLHVPGLTQHVTHINQVPACPSLFSVTPSGAFGQAWQQKEVGCPVRGPGPPVWPRPLQLGIPPALPGPLLTPLSTTTQRDPWLQPPQCRGRENPGDPTSLGGPVRHSTVERVGAPIPSRGCALWPDYLPNPVSKHCDVEVTLGSCNMDFRGTQTFKP